MQLSRLNAMSVGPLWTLRHKKVAAAPVMAATNIAVITVLPDALEDADQQFLFEQIIKSAGWNELSLGVCLNSTPQNLQTSVAAHLPKVLVVFGATAAQSLDLNIGRDSLGKIGESTVIVTHHPAQLIANPALKAQVWTDICLARSLLID